MRGLSPDKDALPRAFGNFALLRRIAAGTRGDVFAALRPVEIERFCALKILKGEVRTRPDFVRALRNEATRRRAAYPRQPRPDLRRRPGRPAPVLRERAGRGDRPSPRCGRKLRERGQPFPVDVAVFVAMEVAAALGAYLRRSARGGRGDTAPAGLSPRVGPALGRRRGEAPALRRGDGGRRHGRRARRQRFPGGARGRGRRVLLVGRLLTEPGRVRRRRRCSRASSSARCPPSPSDAGRRRRDADRARLGAAQPARSRRRRCRRRPPSWCAARRGPGDIPIAAPLAAIAKSFDPRRGASPPTWKVITLTRLETGGGTPRPAAGRRRPISPAGQVIPGTRYRVLSTIGEGGMGTVYAAEHVDLEKKVALKLLRADVARRRGDAAAVPPGGARRLEDRQRRTSATSPTSASSPTGGCSS